MMNKIKILSLTLCFCFCSFLFCNDCFAATDNQVSVVNRGAAHRPGVKARLDARRAMHLQQNAGGTTVVNPTGVLPPTTTKPTNADADVHQIYQQNQNSMRQGK